MKNLNKNQPLRKLPQSIGSFLKTFLLKDSLPLHFDAPEGVLEEII